jgi:hypothetical protein
MDDRRSSTNASAVRHRSNYRVAAAIRQSSNGTHSAVEMAQFGTNAQPETVNGTKSAFETAIDSALSDASPTETSHVADVPSVFPISAELIPDSDVTTVGSISDLAAEPAVTTCNDSISRADIYNHDDGSSRVDDGCRVDDVGQCYIDSSETSDLEFKPNGRETVLVPQCDDFEDPVADSSYSECDKNSLTKGHLQQNMTSDSLFDDNCSEVFEHDNTFLSNYRIVSGNDVRRVVGSHASFSTRPRSLSFPRLSRDFDLSKHLASCKTPRDRMYSMLVPKTGACVTSCSDIIFRS